MFYRCSSSSSYHLSLLVTTLSTTRGPSAKSQIGVAQATKINWIAIFRARPVAMEPQQYPYLQASFGAKEPSSHHIYIYMQHLWDEYCTSLYFGFFEPT